MDKYTSKEQVIITCLKCGGHDVLQNTKIGYASAWECGRPRGAKGQDTYWFENVCPSCGVVEDITVDKFYLCWICGQRATQSISGYGQVDWVSGVPTTVSLCSSEECKRNAEREILRIEEENIQAGYLDE